MLRLGTLLLVSLLRALIKIQGFDAASEGLLAVRQNLNPLHQSSEDRQGHDDRFTAADVDGQMSVVDGTSRLGLRDAYAGPLPPRGVRRPLLLSRAHLPDVDVAFVELAVRHASSPAA